MCFYTRVYHYYYISLSLGRGGWRCAPWRHPLRPALQRARMFWNVDDVGEASEEEEEEKVFDELDAILLLQAHKMCLILGSLV